MPSTYSKYGPLKRGDYNQEKTMRFWMYFKGREVWMTLQRFRDCTIRTYKTYTP